MKPGAVETIDLGAGRTLIRTWSPNADAEGASIGFTETITDPNAGPPPAILEDVAARLAVLESAVVQAVPAVGALLNEQPASPALGAIGGG